MLAGCVISRSSLYCFIHDSTSLWGAWSDYTPDTGLAINRQSNISGCSQHLPSQTPFPEEVGLKEMVGVGDNTDIPELHKATLTDLPKPLQ
jgi:hypothetical protein